MLHINIIHTCWHSNWLSISYTVMLYAFNKWCPCKVRSRRCGCLVTWFCYQMIAKPGNKTAAPLWPDPYDDTHVWCFWNNEIQCIANLPLHQSQLSPKPHNRHRVPLIWVRSRRCGCLVTWFCYQMIAKPGNKTAAPLWPDPYDDTHVWCFRNNEIQCIANLPLYQSQLSPKPHNSHRVPLIWVRSRRCGCLVTWFCYRLIISMVEFKLIRISRRGPRSFQSLTNQPVPQTHRILVKIQ